MNRFLRLVRVVFWLCFTSFTLLALSPAPYLPPLSILSYWDKAQHAIAYGTLITCALHGYPKVDKLRMAVLLFLHGCLIELLQYFSGYRIGDWQDALADGLGVIMGLIFFVILSKFEFMGRSIVKDGSSHTVDPIDAKLINMAALRTSEKNSN